MMGSQGVSELPETTMSERCEDSMREIGASSKRWKTIDDPHGQSAERYLPPFAGLEHHLLTGAIARLGLIRHGQSMTAPVSARLEK